MADGGAEGTSFSIGIGGTLASFFSVGDSLAGGFCAGGLLIALPCVDEHEQRERKNKKKNEALGFHRYGLRSFTAWRAHSPTAAFISLSNSPRSAVVRLSPQVVAQLHCHIMRAKFRAPENLAHEPLAAIAVDRPRGCFPARDNAQPRMLCRVGNRSHDEVSARRTAACAQDVLEIETLAKNARVLACVSPVGGLPLPSNSEPRPTLRPTRIDDGAPGLGFHAYAKTVGALAARLRGLISSLHDDCLGRAEKPGITTCGTAQCQIARGVG